MIILMTVLLCFHYTSDHQSYGRFIAVHWCDGSFVFPISLYSNCQIVRGRGVCFKGGQQGHFSETLFTDSALMLIYERWRRRNRLVSALRNPWIYLALVPSTSTLNQGQCAIIWFFITFPNLKTKIPQTLSISYLRKSYTWRRIQEN
jgi:hypothetical protein